MLLSLQIPMYAKKKCSILHCTLHQKFTSCFISFQNVSFWAFCSYTINQTDTYYISAMKDVRSNVIYVFLGICGMLHSSFCSSQVLAWIWPSSKGPFSALCYTYCPNWSDGKCLLHCGIGSGEIFGCLLSFLAKEVSTSKILKYTVFQVNCFCF